MSAIGDGGDIRSKVVLDLGDMRRGLNQAQGEAKRGGATIGDALKGGLGKAILLTTGIHLSIEGVRAAITRVNSIVGRFEQIRGAGDPAIVTFQRLERSISSVFDNFVTGVLKSQAVQGVMDKVSGVMESAGEAVGGLGRGLDRFVKDHAKGIARFAGEAVGAFELLTSSFKITQNVFRAVSASVQTIAGNTIQFLARVSRDLAPVINAISIGLTGRATQLAAASEAWESFGATLSSVAEVDLSTATADLVGEFARISRAAEDATARVGEVIAKTIDPDRSDVPDLLRKGYGGIFGGTGERDAAVRNATVELANSIGDTWENAVVRIGKLFEDLSTKMTGSVADLRAPFQALSSLSGAFATLGTQAEAAFGKSSRAAKVYNRVQLGLQAVEATVNGLFQLGEAAKNQVANPAAAVLNLAAAGSFFAAAGLAGGRSVGAFGAVGGGRSGSSSSTATLSNEVEKKQVNIVIAIQGNVVGEPEYVRNTLVPELRRLVEEQDVTVVASNLVNDGRT